MLRQLLALYERISKEHAATYSEFKDLETQIRRINDMCELADCVYCLREIAKLLHDNERTADEIKEYCEKIACILWVKSDGTKPIRTSWCSGTPELKTMAALPNRNTNPDGYFSLMRAMGVPEHLTQQDVVRPYWPGLVEHLTSLAESGMPLPDGIDPSKTYPVYVLNVRKKRELSLEFDVSFEPICVHPDNVSATCFEMVG